MLGQYDLDLPRAARPDHSGRCVEQYRFSDAAAALECHLETGKLGVRNEIGFSTRRALNLAVVQRQRQISESDGNVRVYIFDTVSDS